MQQSEEIMPRNYLLPLVDTLYKVSREFKVYRGSVYRIVSFHHKVDCSKVAQPVSVEVEAF